MAIIQILKSYKVDNGDVSGMFKIPADKVTPQMRHDLIDLEGKDAELVLVDAEVVPDDTVPLTIEQMSLKIAKALDEARSWTLELAKAAKVQEMPQEAVVDPQPGLRLEDEA